MMSYQVAYLTIARREITRFLRIWGQTILPSVITMTLYFIVFGGLVGNRIGEMQGFKYIQYITPGLVMMSVITNSYTNVTSSFYLAKFQRNIEEILVAPVPSIIILLGFVTGGIVRGIAIGLVVILVSLFFTHLSIQHFWLMISVIILSSALFSIAGLINALFANSFDDIMLVPTFVLTPLTYLGGVFYSVQLLPPLWQALSRLNPILYMVNMFRYGMLGQSDVDIVFSMSMLVLFVIIAFVSAWVMLDKGVGIRT
ncbi:MAG: ABC transporter permease [Pseudomonadota bacterium]|nr:ABC transporter permease [Pseudomonadota bacterium]